MPSWTEKPVTVPTVNVNMKQCDCASRGEPSYTRPHDRQCAAMPILVPCPIPRSVTFTVRPGECSGRCHDMLWQNPPLHGAECPARPIRVSCSISGKTWAESEVTEAACDGTQWQPSWSPTNAALLAVCRERWALVKALVLGKKWGELGPPDVRPAGSFDLCEQRDAVYAALADMARDEDMHEANLQALFAACPAIFLKGGVSPRPREDRPSARYLAAYVEHLIEQIGAL